MAVEWGLAEEIFSFALTPVFSVEFFYNICIKCIKFVSNFSIMTLKYGILSQSTAVFPQSVINVVNTRSCMKQINTVI